MKTKINSIISFVSGSFNLQTSWREHLILATPSQVSLSSSPPPPPSAPTPFPPPLWNQSPILNLSFAVKKTAQSDCLSSFQNKSKKKMKKKVKIGILLCLSDDSSDIKDEKLWSTAAQRHRRVLNPLPPFILMRHFDRRPPLIWFWWKFNEEPDGREHRSGKTQSSGRRRRRQLAAVYHTCWKSFFVFLSSSLKPFFFFLLVFLLFLGKVLQKSHD